MCSDIKFVEFGENEILMWIIKLGWKNLIKN